MDSAARIIAEIADDWPIFTHFVDLSIDELKFSNDKCHNNCFVNGMCVYQFLSGISVVYLRKAVISSLNKYANLLYFYLHLDLSGLIESRKIIYQKFAAKCRK